MDGFGHVDDGYELLKWNAYSGATAITYAAGIGADGGWGASLDGNVTFYIQKNLPSNKTTIITGCRYKFTAFDSSNQFISWYDGGTQQLEARVLADGSIGVYRSTTLLAQSSPGLVSTNTWHYISFKITFSNTVGQITCKIGSTTIINTAANLDTCATANEYCNAIYLYSLTTTVYIDDFYIADTVAGNVADIVGDVKITTLYPDADGTYDDFTPSDSGGLSYAMIDEAQLVAETDYTYSTTVGHKLTTSMTTYSDVGTIYGVQTCAAVKNSDAGTMNVRTLIRSGEVPTDTEGADFLLSQTVKACLTVFEHEPEDTVDWTAGDINAAEFGVKIQP